MEGKSPTILDAMWQQAAEEITTGERNAQEIFLNTFSNLIYLQLW
jgi:hypothetical protein